MSTEHLQAADDAFVADRYPMNELVQAWQALGPDAHKHAQVLGVDGAFAAAVIADMCRRIERPVILISPTQESAARLAADLNLFTHDARSVLEEADEEHPRDEIALFPEFDIGPFHEASADRHITMQRLVTLERLLSDRPPLITVTSARAMMRRTISPAVMRRMTRTFQIEDELDNKSLRSYLSDCGYIEVPVVEDPGTFAIRGDIVDIFSPHAEYPMRLERWGDELAELRSFHPQTQRTIAEHDKLVVFPVRQEILDKPSVELAHERLYKLGAQCGTPLSSIKTMLADLRAGLHFIGIDAILPALHEELGELTDFLSKDTLVVIVKPEATLTSMMQLWEKRERERAVWLEQEGLLFDVDQYYVPPADFARWASTCWGRVDVSNVQVVPNTEELNLGLADEEMTFSFRARGNDDLVRIRKSCHGVEHMIKELATKLEDWTRRFGRISIACRTMSQVDRLEQLLTNFWGGEVRKLPTPIHLGATHVAPAASVDIYHAPLSQGFRSQMLGACVIAGSEIFGARVANKVDASTAFSEQAAISHFRELSAGDLIVHVDFGIGRYLGLIHMNVEGVGSDFLQLEYAGGDKLYLPIYRLGRVQRYIGGGDHVRLDKLGGNGWEKTKEKVKENIRAIAGDLLTLYAKREMAKGFAFSPPDDMYHEFENRFPFEETVDQGRAIIETIKDMQRIRPMDRLVCGDVGFGKTEVAIRAAMKAVLDGKQVAVLVPTTILAEQHQISFKKRMGDFGVVVECLSRFRTSKETKEIIERAEAGKVDVLVGTHRLLGKQVKFNELGLMIVDEEQRFGVVHKEKLKKLKNNIDVLTLTATPIPRTLQMSLLGIRDLSIIATPPHNRLAVRTHVAKFSDAIIREAIMRELGRGGQVFFVHNRVATIEEMATHLRELIPEARIGIGHGQMHESKLEEVMLSYIKGDINILLCSSIVESGLDIPNANTIIVNRADMFGLAQLYQLRGRVGRGKERAYAYLLIPARGKLSKDSEKRLEVIQTHTELGSGFHVASYDLEIRGAGNLLGDNQSGHVSSVGLDLYNDLLEEAVNDIRGEEVEDDLEPEVNIAVETFIPDDYIPATSLRLMFYKRFSLARDLGELDEIYDEMVDRFGQAPGQVANLRQIVAIKIGLRQMRAQRLDAGPSAISIELDATTRLSPQAVLEMVEKSRGKLTLTAQMKLIYKLKPDESAAPMRTSRNLIDSLLATL